MSNGITAWSYSRYADYRQCPLRFKLKYIDKLPEPGSPAMQRGGDIHKKGENWLKAKRTGALPREYVHFADEMRQLRGLNPMVEQQWGFTRQWEPTSWFGSATWLRVICDVAVVYEDGDADVIDFKTGRKYDTNVEQMELFGTAIMFRFPEVNRVTARLWYLDQEKDNVVEDEYLRKDLPRVRKSWEQKTTAMFKDKRFAPTPNEKCRWCHFSKDKGGPCPYNGG
jgi:putative RecB family exonuclease